MKDKTTTIISLIIIVILVAFFSGCQSTVTEKTKETALPETTKIESSQELTEKPEKTTEPTEAPSTNDSEITDAEEEFIRQRIENYTKVYFRFTEDVQVCTEDDKASVSVKFVPEVGSIIIKEDLYENIAVHAYQIIRFFPEVTHFYYIVLGDDYTKNEDLYVTINEESVENLESSYVNQLVNRNGGLETHFAKVFSEIVETEESKTWRERVEPNAILP